MMVATFLWIKNHPPIVDEIGIHYFIKKIISHPLDLKASFGDKTQPYATLPTYHFLIAGIAKITNVTTLSGLRGYSFIFGLISIFAFLISARKLDPDFYDIRTVQYCFFPILFPYFFLLYTDVTSLLFILLMLYGFLRESYLWTGLFGIAGMLIRQNNIVWLTPNRFVTGDPSES